MSTKPVEMSDFVHLHKCLLTETPFLMDIVKVTDFTPFEQPFMSGDHVKKYHAKMNYFEPSRGMFTTIYEVEKFNNKLRGKISSDFKNIDPVTGILKNPLMGYKRLATKHQRAYTSQVSKSILYYRNL